MQELRPTLEITVLPGPRVAMPSPEVSQSLALLGSVLSTELIWQVPIIRICCATRNCCSLLTE